MRYYSHYRNAIFAASVIFIIFITTILHRAIYPKANDFAVPLRSAIVSTSSTSSPWQINISENNGLPVIAKGGGIAMSSSFVFWGRNWHWAGLNTEFKIESPFHYFFSGQNKNLDFDLTGEIRKISDYQLVWEFDLDAQSFSQDVIGGGMEFKFDLVTFGAELGEPELLPDNRGWVWGKEGGCRVEMRFDPAMATVYFERGKKNQLRAFFYKGTIPKGQKHYMVTLTLPKDFVIVPTVRERFGQVDPANWSEDVIDWRTSPVDLSFLNASEKPAGSRGFVQAQGDKLVYEDGTSARFWGTNITAYTLFCTPKEMVRQQARRLSALGFNLVRLHHHDSSWVNPNVFGDKSKPDTRQLDAESLDRLDWWIKCLKDEGIYVWLDLHVGRKFKPGDEIEGFKEIASKASKGGLQGYNYVNSSIQIAMKRFNEAYVNHLNAYTNLRYKDEPAIAAMLITNENDITHHFGNALLPDKNVPFHNKIYMREAEEFAGKHGMPKKTTWRSWEHGPSKIFLNDFEHRFHKEMIDHLRRLGVKVPIVTTNTWGGNPLSSLPALTDGDIIDVHAYGGIGEIEKNPMICANMVHWLAAGQVAGKPMSVTEWNVSPFPVPDRHVIPLYMAGSASHQGWDALMEYAYSQVPLKSAGGPSNWHAYNDPSLLATLPAAALLYRQGHVQEAATTAVLDLGKKTFFYQAVSPENSVFLRTAAEKGKVLIAMPEAKELPWLKRDQIPKHAEIYTNPDIPLLKVDTEEVISDTGEIRRNWEKGIYTINTPRTQAAMGWIGGAVITLPDVEIAVETKNATVAVQSLDNQPISRSQCIFVSLGAQSEPKEHNKLPFLSEPVLGRLRIRAPEGLTFFQKGVDGKEKVEIPAAFKDGWYSIELDESLRTYWLFLEKV